MISTFLSNVVVWCWKRPWTVIAVAITLTLLSGILAATHLGMDADESKLLADDLPFKQAEARMVKAFPDLYDDLVVVIDAPTPGQANKAADQLLARLIAHPEAIAAARLPGGTDFFRHNGLLYLSTAEVQTISDQLTAAQPVLGTLARDPSAHGLATVLTLMAEGVARDEANAADVTPATKAALLFTQAALAHRSPPSLGQLSTNASLPTRAIMLVRPVLDFSDITPGIAASNFIREQAKDLNLTPANGYRLRLTGPVALTDDNFATVVKGAGLTGLLSTAAILILLWLAVRSIPLVLAILSTLICGLSMTAAFAALTVGTLNPISVAFAVMFVGIAVDFAIQFVVRYRDLRLASHSDAQAIASCALVIVNPLGLAALASAVGFLSFLPTEYRGVSQLGLVAGGGMIIALIIDLTLLPALLHVIHPRGHQEMSGLPLAAPLDRAMRTYGRLIVGAAVALGIVGLVLSPKLHFDVNTLDLQDPNAEAVSTLLDLARSPDTTPYFIDTLAADAPQAQQWVKKFEAMPEVLRVADVSGFVPDDQDAKLAMIGDISDIYQSVLAEGARLPPSDPEQTSQALQQAANQLQSLVLGGKPVASPDLISNLEQLAHDPAATKRLDQMLSDVIVPNVGLLRNLLSAKAVGLGDLPGDLVEEWRTTDGRYKVTVWPKGDMNDTTQLGHFVHDVQSVDPLANGMPVSMTGAGEVVVHSFVKAAGYAIVSILILLGLALRRWLDAVLVVLPLALGALYSVIGCVAFGLSINFANIIALPLLLGIGVAFNIYFVTNWRNGVKDHLSTATGRAVLYSALTTSSAFGSLAASPHVGTASMGLLLFLSVGLSVATTFLVLPALLNIIPNASSSKHGNGANEIAPL